MRFAILLAVLMLFALPGGLCAQSAPFHIPFAFIGFDSDFPAGYYRVDRLNTFVLKITSGDSNEVGSKCVSLRLKGEYQSNGIAYMLFEKVGDFYVLREYRNGVSNTSMSTPLSKERQAWERTYIAKHLRGEFVLIAAR
jgi:hypothetical protein